MKTFFVFVPINHTLFLHSRFQKLRGEGAGPEGVRAQLHPRGLLPASPRSRRVRLREAAETALFHYAIAGETAGEVHLGRKYNKTKRFLINKKRVLN